MSAVIKIWVNRYSTIQNTDHFKLGDMYRRDVLTILVLFIGSIDAYSDNGKICPRNLILNGTNLITNYRKQILVMGITHLGCQACRNQAVR
jgi:hypothetical protein